MQKLPFFDLDHLELRQRVRAWVDANLFSNANDEKDLEARARRLVKGLGQAGFTRYVVPSAYGGVRERIQARELCIMREELARGLALLSGEMTESIDFIRNGIVMEVIGREGLPFLPFLTSIFVFIWVNNLYGIIPGIQFPTTARMAMY